MLAEFSFKLSAERDGGNFDLLYQNSVRKCEDDLEHYIFYILYDLPFNVMALPFCK